MSGSIKTVVTIDEVDHQVEVFYHYSPAEAMTLTYPGKEAELEIEQVLKLTGEDVTAIVDLHQGVFDQIWEEIINHD